MESFLLMWRRGVVKYPDDGHEELKNRTESEGHWSSRNQLDGCHLAQGHEYNRREVKS
jgi:hypothetical protein